MKADDEEEDEEEGREEEGNRAKGEKQNRIGVFLSFSDKKTTIFPKIFRICIRSEPHLLDFF